MNNPWRSKFDNDGQRLFIVTATAYEICGRVGDMNSMLKAVPLDLLEDMVVWLKTDEAERVMGPDQLPLLTRLIEASLDYYKLLLRINEDYQELRKEKMIESYIQNNLN